MGLALAGCLAMQGPARAQEKVAKTSMIELYTSQGCKSCPRADRNFARYANDPHVLALSFHVNYWDYMGWRDTLATQENADRQTAYRRAQKARMVYTPQAIIDGRTQVNGRDMTAIEAQTAHRRLDVPVSIRQIDSNRLSIEIGAGEKPKTPLHVVLFYFRDPVTVPITAGENAGQSVTYRNAVNGIDTIGLWDGKPMKIELPTSELVRRKASGCAVALQETAADDLPGPIHGGAIFKSSAPPAL
ncbi:MAG: DUF1223 domain-containing protein [Rhizobiales bacterium]|nr:DUF1223 domain-containing protein [Hyphomicrobiales bacterium]OJY07220.1 MAG: hypothetical protein BGP07_18065 [Rhizobiales bacterium 63-22]